MESTEKEILTASDVVKVERYIYFERRGGCITAGSSSTVYLLVSKETVEYIFQKFGLDLTVKEDQTRLAVDMSVVEESEDGKGLEMALVFKIKKLRGKI